MITRPAGDRAPESSRGLDAATIGTLLVSVSGSTLGIAQVVGIVRGWLRRGTPEGKAEPSYGGKTVTLSGATAVHTQRLVVELAASFARIEPPAAESSWCWSREKRLVKSVS